MVYAPIVPEQWHRQPNGNRIGREIRHSLNFKHSLGDGVNNNCSLPGAMNWFKKDCVSQIQILRRREKCPVRPYSRAVNSHVSKPKTESPASLSILLSGEQADDHIRRRPYKANKGEDGDRIEDKNQVSVDRVVRATRLGAPVSSENYGDQQRI